MIEQSAVVVRVEPEHLIVDCDTRRACERCARGEGCGGGLLQAILGEGGKVTIAGVKVKQTGKKDELMSPWPFDTEGESDGGGGFFSF